MSLPLPALLDRARAVLLDFDGPVCDVYAGHPAPLVAQQVRDALGLHDADSTATDDPLVVLRHATEGAHPARARHADAVLRAAELEAVDSARPTPGAADFLHACRRAGLPVAIVSNNSEPAIRRYLTRRHLDELVTTIAGRPAGRADLMKPAPYLISRALRALAVLPHAAFLVGDSTTDVEAAHAAGTPALGYANKPGKAARLEAAGAEVVIDTMRELAHALRARAAL